MAHIHQKEIIRWANSPKGTQVWVREKTSKEWVSRKIPYWLDDNIYVVDDIDAELRKTWIDEGKPPVQYYDEVKNKWIDTEDPAWCTKFEYRIKPSEWETPEGEDPIRYHAKRLDPDWKLNWSDKTQTKTAIFFDVILNEYNYMPHWKTKYMNIVYISGKAAIKIVQALNSGKLKIGGIND